MGKSQVESGKAFEYGLALKFASILEANVINNKYLKNAEAYFNTCDEKEKILYAASEAIHFLQSVDDRLSEYDCEIRTQSDQAGAKGDVRDIIICNTKLNEEIGISAKNRHDAVKHSRLSSKIDFGKKWFGYPCSKQYFENIKPVFDELNNLRNKGELFRNLPNKQDDIYVPILKAFKDEMLIIKDKCPDMPTKLIDYLIGKYDFYKVIKENGDVLIQSFNIHGTLKWGKKIPKPMRIIEAEFKEDSKNTLMFIFDRWQISFRIHSAKAKVEPSLKFDVRLLSMPPASGSHTIPIYG